MSDATRTARLKALAEALGGEWTEFIGPSAREAVAEPVPPVTFCGVDRAGRFSVLLSEDAVRDLVDQAEFKTIPAYQPLVDAARIALTDHDRDKAQEEWVRDAMHLLKLSHEDAPSVLRHLWDLAKGTEPT